MLWKFGMFFPILVYLGSQEKSGNPGVWDPWERKVRAQRELCSYLHGMEQPLRWIDCFGRLFFFNFEAFLSNLHDDNVY
jgi:hypothetical protein